MSAALALMQLKRAIPSEARNYLMKSQNNAKRYAIRKAQELSNTAKRRVNAGITNMVNKHVGNNPNARRLANSLKAHITGQINAASKFTRNRINAAPPLKM